MNYASTWNIVSSPDFDDAYLRKESGSLVATLNRRVSYHGFALIGARIWKTA